MITIAIIGAGYWGPNHIRLFSSFPNSVVKMVSDLDRPRLEKIEQNFPHIKTTTDYKHILEDPEIDAIVVATPTATHFELVRDALYAKKHVLCEKPLCKTAEQAMVLNEIAKQNQRILMTGHVFLFNQGIIKLYELLNAGEMGQPLYMSAVRTNLGPIRSDVNASYDLAAHDISIFNWLLNEVPIEVSATGGSFIQSSIEDVVFISLRYSSGVVASINASWLDPKKVRQITLVGSSKMATWDDMQPATPISIYDKGVNTSQEYNTYGEFLRISMWDGDVRLPKIKTEEPLRLQDATFLSAIQTGELNRSGGDFSVGVVKTLHAISESMKLRGCPIQVEL
jgi:predicted dehydrogenase